MGSNVQGLNDYLQILKSPDIYPDIAGAGFFMSPLISVVSTIIAFAGILAMLLVLLRIGADVLIMSGAGTIFSGSKGAGKQIEKFASKDIEDCIGNPWAYLKKEGYKIILMLAFVGLMISGYMLPLAGTVTASMGAVITKVADINPVPYIEALDISTLSLSKQVDKSSLTTLMKQYSKHAGNMTSARQQALKSEALSDTEYKNASVAYAKSYYSAEIYRYILAGHLHNIKVDARQEGGDKPLTSEQEQLRNFNYTAHLSDVDYILLNKGKSNDTQVGELESEANRAATAYKGLSATERFEFTITQ